MLEQKIIESKPVSLVEVKELLKERAKAGELTYEQTLTQKYASKYAKLTQAKANKLQNELNSINGMNEDLAIKIIDILPIEMEVLELLIPKNSSIKKDSFQPILDIVKKFATDSEKEKS